MTKGENVLSTHKVQQGSQEWQSVEQNFLTTMPNATVQEIMRIQNLLIWNTFQTEITNFQILRGEPPQVKMLYHGTSDNDPKSIYAH
jgi:hypothetical protein